MRHIGRLVYTCRIVGLDGLKRRKMVIGFDMMLLT